MSLVERVAEAIHPWICADPHEGISGNAHKAANAALMAQGFVTCQTCGGKGRIYTEPNDPGYTCDCRLGVVPSEAMIERAALTMDLGAKKYRMRIAKAALLEAFGGDDECPTT